MRFVLLGACLSGMLSTVIAADVNDCYKRSPDAITFHCPWRFLGVDYEKFDLYDANIRVDTGTSIKFQTKGKNDAHVLLQYDRHDFRNKVIEIVIGGWFNQKSVIRDAQQGSSKVEYNSPVLSDKNYQWFWISWEGGIVRVGKGETIGSDEFMSWNGLSHDINGISVSYGYGSAGSFVFYKAGSTFTFSDGCDTCSCTLVDNIYDVSCASAVCPQLPCEESYQIFEEDGCCPKCKPGCYVDQIGHVEIGPYKTKDPCEHCVCEEDCRTACAIMYCDPCSSGYTNVPDGSCCGKCVVTCEIVKCPSLQCKNKDKIQEEGKCCPECKCKYKGEVVMPGPVGDKCDGCECTNGKVTCSKPVCTTKVKCVDPVMGDDCCYKCPRGETCRDPKTKKSMLKEDQPKIFGKNICMCSPGSWYPYALCAPKKVKSSAFPGVEDYESVVEEWDLPKK